MVGLTSAVVQVVTSGVDWPAVATAIAGGVIGLAGIVATVLQSGRRIAAEDERVKLVEKRRIYARFHSSLDNVFAVASDKSPRSTSDKLSDLYASFPAMYNSASELRLIAPTKIGKKAREVAFNLANKAVAAINDRREVDANNEIYDLREQLYALMRADLGEPNAGGQILPRAAAPETGVSKAPHQLPPGAPFGDDERH